MSASAVRTSPTEATPAPQGDAVSRLQCIMHMHTAMLVQSFSRASMQDAADC